MTDDIKLNLDSIGKDEGKGLVTSFSPSLIKEVVMIRLEINRYPNGSKFINARAWFTDVVQGQQGTQHPQKKRKGKIELPKMKVAMEDETI